MNYKYIDSYSFINTIIINAMYNNNPYDTTCIEPTVVPVYMVTTQSNPIHSNNPDYYNNQDYSPLYSNNFNNTDCNIQMLPISNDDTNQTLSVSETNTTDSNINFMMKYGFVILSIMFVIGCIVLITNPNHIIK